MEAKESLVHQLEEVLKKVEKDNKSLDSYISLNEANDFYNVLLKKGLIKKRGYTLRGIEDSHLFNVRLKY